MRIYCCNGAGLMVMMRVNCIGKQIKLRNFTMRKGVAPKRKSKKNEI